MTTETPPDEVLLEAAKRSHIGAQTVEYLRRIYRHGGGFTALCDMIQKYEKKPVDRKRLCALEARDSTGAEATTVAIAIRAIELWEEGFGK
jgi:hypothetical protein